MQGLGEALACQRRHVGRGRQAGAVHRRAQAAQHRHRQQATEFVGDFLHRRGHARTVRRHIIEDGGGRHRDGRAHAKAGDGHAGHHPAQAVREAERNHADTHRACGQATADQRTQADPVQDAAAQQRAGQAAQRRHRDQQARLQRGEARHQLEALGGDQLQAGHREQGEHRRQRAGQERGIAEDREVQQRVRQLLLAPRERRTADDRQQQRAGTERVRRRRGDQRLDRQHQPGQRSQRQHRRHQNPWARGIALAFRRQQQRGHATGEERPQRGDCQRGASTTVAGHLVTVQHGHHRGRFPWQCHKNRRRGAAVLGAVIDTCQHDQAGPRGQHVRDREQHRDGRDGADARQHANQRTQDAAQHPTSGCQTIP
ncbi:hypothetical protein G6F24_013759 [Rhizopus arrhizus]|nr:hypothetical protein G6F24_013759 [Rhizopus arrhizus]